MHRRKGSGIYEYRKRLPISLAGRPAPQHVRSTVPELINPSTGRFKREFTKSLDTADLKVARLRNAREASRVEGRIEIAERMLRAGPPVPTEADRAEMAETVVEMTNARLPWTSRARPGGRGVPWRAANR